MEMMTNLDNVSASSHFSLVELVFVLIVLLNCLITFQDFYSSFRFISYFSKQTISHIRFLFQAWKLDPINKNCNKLEAAESSIETEKKLTTLEEVKMTIEGVARLEEIDFDGMFEELSLEEVREAFGVFDENGDGFIDASELRNVLCRLSFREEEASEAECGRMITAFDDDKDGRIDFNEFVKLLESSFSS